MSDLEDRLIFEGYAWDKYEDELVRIETYHTEGRNAEDTKRWPVDVWVSGEIEDGEASESRKYFANEYGPFYASVEDFKKDIEVPLENVWPTDAGQ